MQRPPDANHPWRYDQTRRGWFYLVNGNHRIYHDSTPRFTPIVGQQAPSGSNYQHVATGRSGAGPGGSLPIAIRPGPTTQSGHGPIRSPDSTGSSQYTISTGLSPRPQLPGAGRGRGFVPPADGLQPGQVDSAIAQATNDAPELTEEQQQKLDENFQKRKRPREFFRLGKVFLMLHTEAFGNTQGRRGGRTTVNTLNRDIFVVAFGEKAFSKVRRFIVVSEQANSCSALAITSHNGKGAAPKNALDHGIVYTGPSPPRPAPSEGKMLTLPIRIDPAEKYGTLHPASRVDYAKTYNIEHNVKVKPFGMVNNQFLNHLIRQWAQVLMRRSNPAQSAFNAISPATLRDLGFTTGMIRAVLVMMAPRSKGPSADARTSITSVARNSAKEELKAAEEEDASTKEKLANEAEAAKLSNQVVELIVAGMPYNLAVDHVRQLSENGNGYEGEDDAVGDDDDEGDDDEDEQEEEGDGASSSSSSEGESDEE